MREEPLSVSDGSGERIPLPLTWVHTLVIGSEHSFSILSLVVVVDNFYKIPVVADNYAAVGIDTAALHRLTEHEVGTGASLVVRAIHHGRQAAKAIDKYLKLT